MLTINQELQNGRFRITKQFGQGKSVSFYEAVDKTIEKNILLKRLSFTTNVNGNSVEIDLQSTAFLAESKFLSDLQHDGILQILDHFVEDTAQYLVMELVDGQNVGELLRKAEVPFAVADMVDWGEQILDTLHYLHKKSPPVIYFNLRPSNIHLKANGKIKLLATGIGSRPGVAGNTANHSFEPGNVSYTPLELIWQKLDAGTKRVILKGYDEKAETVLLLPPDERCDTYSVGASLYQLLTKQIPVDALERSIELLEGKEDPLISPEKLNPGVSPEISEFLTKALQIRRENRFQSVLEMRKDLVDAFIKLRERKAQQLRSEVPVTPGVTRRPVRPAQILQTESSEDVPATLNLKVEDLENGFAQTSVKQPSKKVPIFGMDLELLDHVNEKGEQISANSSEEFIVKTVEEAKPIQDTNDASEEDWQEEFTDDWEKPNLNEDEWNDEPIQYKTGDEFQYLLGTPKKTSKFGKKLVFAGIGMILLGGAAFGVVNWLPVGLIEPIQEVSTQVVPAPEIFKNDAASPEIKVVSSPETSGAQVSAVSSPVAEPEKNALIRKEKTPAAQAEIVKNPDVSKSTTNKDKNVSEDDLINDKPKKKVTVDDLINDN